jgi:glycosyltransferase involved in cell wall biosynthesis
MDVLKSLEGQFTIYLVSPEVNNFNTLVAGILHPYPVTQYFSAFPIGRLIKRLVNYRIIRLLDLAVLRLCLHLVACDIVLVNGFGSWLTWREVRRCLAGRPKKSVISRESPRHFSQGDVEVPLALHQAFLSDFEYTIFVSKRLQAEFAETIDLNPRKSYYLPNCCNEEPLLLVQQTALSKASYKQELGIDRDSVFILNVGGLELRKGQQDLFELAKRLSAHGFKYKVACVGPINSSCGQQLMTKVLESSVGSHFIFPGPVGNMRPWYASADLLIFTSRAEAMPRTILEAMASGIPIVTTDVDGIPELIKPQLSGFLYHPGDVDTLENLTTWLIHNRPIAEEIGLAGRSAYLENFSRAHHKARLASILFDIASR